jgi:hypothetical protein
MMENHINNGRGRYLRIYVASSRPREESYHPQFMKFI